MRYRVTVVLCAALIALILTSCASSDPAATGSDGSGAIGGAKTVERDVVPDGCTETRAAFKDVAGDMLAVAAPTATSADVDRFRAHIAAARASVPAEVQSDVDVWSSTLEEYARAVTVSAVGTNPPNGSGSAPAGDPAAILDRPEFKAASANLDSFFKDNCASSPGTTAEP